MIDADWKLCSAVSDNCSLYEPDTDKPTWVISSRKGMIYKCKNFTQRNGVVIGQCLWCENIDTWKTDTWKTDTSN